jgi:hypothetical protein
MTVKYIREDRVPEGAQRPRFRPEYRELWAEYEKIMPNYLDPAYTGTFTSVNDSDETGTFILQTSVLYFNSLEAISEFKAAASAYLEEHINPIINQDHFPSNQGIKRRFQIRDITTDEVIQDWTEIN